MSAQRMKNPMKPVRLTIKEAQALCHAWAVLHDGQTSTKYNGGDFQPRHETRDRAAARVLDNLLDRMGWDEDAE